MNKWKLLMACGAAIAISTPVLAQNDARQPEQQREQQPERLKREGVSQIDSILAQLKGMWRVDIQINQRLMPELEGQLAPTTQPQDTRDASPDREAPPQDGSSNRSQPVQPDDDAIGGGQSLSGYAHTTTVLGDNVLRENIVILNGEDDEFNQSPSMQILSFLTFDEQNKTYSMVFITEKGKMHFDEGSYDAESKRIVFHGGAEKANTTMKPGDGAESGASAQPAGPEMENVRVVLEILGHDSHKVTMYSTASAKPAMDDSKDRAQPQQKPDRVNPEDEKGALALSDRILYVATFTRAEGVSNARDAGGGSGG